MQSKDNLIAIFTETISRDACKSRLEHLFLPRACRVNFTSQRSFLILITILSSSSYIQGAVKLSKVGILDEQCGISCCVFLDCEIAVVARVTQHERTLMVQEGCSLE